MGRWENGGEIGEDDPCPERNWQTSLEEAAHVKGLEIPTQGTRQMAKELGVSDA
jgi:hypothetical protein